MGGSPKSHGLPDHDGGLRGAAVLGVAISTKSCEPAENQESESVSRENRTGITKPPCKEEVAEGSPLRHQAIPTSATSRSSDSPGDDMGFAKKQSPTEHMQSHLGDDVKEQPWLHGVMSGVRSKGMAPLVSGRNGEETRRLEASRRLWSTDRYATLSVASVYMPLSKKIDQNTQSGFVTRFFALCQRSECRIR